MFGGSRTGLCCSGSSANLRGFGVLFRARLRNRYSPAIPLVPTDSSRIQCDGSSLMINCLFTSTDSEDPSVFVKQHERRPSPMAFSLPGSPRPLRSPALATSVVPDMGPRIFPLSNRDCATKRCPGQLLVADIIFFERR